MSWPNKTERYWWPRHVTVPTISVSDISEDARKEREEKIKQGARVVPFGFSRVLAPDPPPDPEPLLWEGED